MPPRSKTPLVQTGSPDSTARPTTARTLGPPILLHVQQPARPGHRGFSPVARHSSDRTSGLTRRQAFTNHGRCSRTASTGFTITKLRKKTLSLGPPHQKHWTHTIQSVIVHDPCRPATRANRLDALHRPERILKARLPSGASPCAPFRHQAFVPRSSDFLPSGKPLTVLHRFTQYFYRCPLGQRGHVSTEGFS